MQSRISSSNLYPPIGSPPLLAVWKEDMIHSLEERRDVRFPESKGQPNASPISLSILITVRPFEWLVKLIPDTEKQ